MEKSCRAPSHAKTAGYQESRVIAPQNTKTQRRKIGQGYGPRPKDRKSSGLPAGNEETKRKVESTKC